MMLGERTVPRSRKEHTCTWCGEKILKGETYHRYTWVDCGDMGTVKMHLECQQASGEVAAQEGGNVEFEPYSYHRGSGCYRGDGCPCHAE